MPTRITRFASLPGHEKLMCFEAILMLAIARMLIVLMPFSWWNRLLKIDRNGSVANSAKVSDQSYHPLGRQIGRIVRMVARHMPFKAVCLPQAMAAQWMLSRRGIASAIVFGAGHNEEKQSLDLHAWLISEEIIITGKYEHERFQAFISQTSSQDHLHGNRDPLDTQREHHS